MDAARAGAAGDPSEPGGRTDALDALNAEVVACRRCPRLVAWRERTAREKVARYRGEEYWGRPVPSFGDPAARILIVGLAPAAHGGNRTGRMFTGDRSGDFLYRALHENGLASSPISERRDDGLTLTGVRISAIVHCAPPANIPTTDERDACLPYLGRELRLLPDLRVIVALGGFAWDGLLRALAGLGLAIPRPRPRFGHGAEARIGSHVLLGSFHPSQQNTFTGRLTAEMLRAVLGRARIIADLGPVEGDRP
ncbi:MAG: uracil-DNA glycosylase [Chloroflexota bacterium]|nr:uracil-DNA glycosylase [Chloroflexota bacterium]